MNRKTFTYFSSLFLGNRADVSKFYMDEMKQEFRLWGLSHYLARGGLHLILIIAVWLSFLRLLPLGIKTKNILLTLLMLLYCTLSWFNITFIRACSCFFIYQFLVITDQQVHRLHILTLVTFTILFFNPVQLFALDFQLSFGLTFSLILFNQLQHQRRLLAKTIYAPSPT